MAHTLTVKGQVTIPKAVREHLGLVPGSRVEFTREADGTVSMRRAGGPRDDFAERVAAARRFVPVPFAGGKSTEDLMREWRGDDDA
jgi:AbrB family looped-hinge helix DNA binding protein